MLEQDRNKMYLSVLPEATQLQPTEQQQVIQFSTQDFSLYELKGKLDELTSFELPQYTSDMIWLGFLFQGTLTLPNGATKQTNTAFYFVLPSNNRRINLDAGNQWILFLGISGICKQQLLSELPLLQSLVQHVDSPSIRISSYVQKKLDCFYNANFGPFSSFLHVGQLVLNLYSDFLQQWNRHPENVEDKPNVKLYKQAIDFIKEHYMEGDLNRDMISQALDCNIRSLSRAFVGRPLSLNNSIIVLRLYKARALLQKKPGLSVEQIALSVHFSSPKYFAVQYKKYFHCTPREERQLTLSFKKKS